jgi:hypothetical protein
LTGTFRRDGGFAISVDVFSAELVASGPFEIEDRR